MLLSAGFSHLVLIDLQERLAPAIEGVDQVLANVDRLVTAARRLRVPVTATEQYPKGLGPTVAALRARLQPGEIVEKIHFSAAREVGFTARFRAGAQAVLAGTEAHVCVLQTAIGLAAEGIATVVVRDAVGTRHAEDKTVALDRLARHGVDIVTTEMVLFEWLARADTAEFRDLLVNVRR